MSRIAYVNGQYVPHIEAAVHVEDRGYQFADGVYEVFGIHGGKLIGEKGHMDRLNHSLGELSIAWPMSRRALAVIVREVARRNRIRDGLIYLQVTRGVAKRDHPILGLGAIVRDGKMICPRGSTVVQAKDRVVLFAAEEVIRKVEKMFSVQLEYF